MNKDFETLLDILRHRGPNCPRQFHTNAMLLTRKRAARIAANAGALSVYLSIDGGTAESHDANRGSGTFKRALSGARELLRAREGHPTLKVFLYQLELGIPPADYDPEFLALASDCDGWQRVAPVLDEGEESPPAAGPLLPSSALSKKARGAEYRSSHVSSNPLKSCFWAGNSLNIAPDGSVSVCILSSRSDGVLGNVLDEGVDRLLDKASAWRMRLDSDTRSCVAHCSKCMKSEGQGRPRDES